MGEMMSNPTKLLQAAVHAVNTEKNPERAKQLSQEIMDTYPDSRQARSAQIIIDRINADAVGAAKKAKQTKDTTYTLGVGAAGHIRAIVGAVILISTGFPIVLIGFVPPGPLIAIAVGLVVFVGILTFPFFGLIRSDDRKINKSNPIRNLYARQDADIAAPIAEEIPGTSSDLDQDLSHLSPFQRKHYRLQQNLALSEKDNGDSDLKSSD